MDSKLKNFSFIFSIVILAIAVSSYFVIFMNISAYSAGGSLLGEIYGVLFPASFLMGIVGVALGAVVVSISKIKGILTIIFSLTAGH